MTTLVGRSLQQGQAPYRPLTEALFASARAGALPDAPELRPFRHALGTIVPDWRAGSGGEESSLIIGEGVLRLARVLGGGRDTLLVVEDLHWADADTIEVIDRRVHRRDRDPGRGGRVVATRSEGLPLLVEELLSVPVSGVSQAVPTTFGDAVSRRVRALPAGSVLVVECAAVLGRRFDWRLLPAVTALSQSEVRRGQADAVAVQLLSADAEGGFRFRHALTRDAVLAGLLPPTRVALSRRAAQAVGLESDDDTQVLLAADLWCAAGAPETEAGGLVEAGRRALARGAPAG